MIDMDPFIIPQPKYTQCVSCDLKAVSVRRNTSRISEAYLRTIYSMESGFINFVYLLVSVNTRAATFYTSCNSVDFP